MKGLLVGYGSIGEALGELHSLGVKQWRLCTLGWGRCRSNRRAL